MKKISVLVVSLDIIFLHKSPMRDNIFCLVESTNLTNYGLFFVLYTMYSIGLQKNDVNIYLENILPVIVRKNVFKEFHQTREMCFSEHPYKTHKILSS